MMLIFCFDKAQLRNEYQTKSITTTKRKSQNLTLKLGSHFDGYIDANNDAYQ